MSFVYGKDSFRLYTCLNSFPVRVKFITFRWVTSLLTSNPSPSQVLYNVQCGQERVYIEPSVGRDTKTLSQPDLSLYFGSDIVHVKHVKCHKTIMFIPFPNSLTLLLFTNVYLKKNTKSTLIFRLLNTRCQCEKNLRTVVNWLFQSLMGQTRDKQVSTGSHLLFYFWYYIHR